MDLNLDQDYALIYLTRLLYTQAANMISFTMGIIWWNAECLILLLKKKKISFFMIKRSEND